MFEDRSSAGFTLAKKLKKFVSDDSIVVGIPRGGAVVAYEIAKILKLPLTLLIIKKIGSPKNSELAIGAVGPQGYVFWDKNLIKKLGISRHEMVVLKLLREREVKEREKLFLKNERLRVFGKKVILVDDGVATGASVKLASRVLKKMGAKELILATPVIPSDTLSEIKIYFDTIIKLITPYEFYAVGQFYKNFLQVSDDEVLKIMLQSKRRMAF